MAEEDLLCYKLTRTIIGSAMEVHKILGHGFLEKVYEEALSIEFELRKIGFQRQKEYLFFIKKDLQKILSAIFLWEILF